MDYNALIDIGHEVQGQLWVDRVNETYATGRLCEWVSTFHPEQLPCQLDGGFYYGAFNAGVKMIFSDSSAWMVRFPHMGKVYDDLADEKVTMEVRALRLIRRRTSIPVPDVRAWGTAASNPLGLGPFIIMDFINGVSLSDILEDPKAEHATRLIRKDISNSDIEFIYRQFSKFLLQLFELDFDSIRNLPPLEGEAEAEDSMPTCPLTFKAHSILQGGGVDTFGDRRQKFATATEYLGYLARQDWEQLIYQPNSVTGPYDARHKYVDFQVLQSLIPDFVNKDYDHGKFKLICDDLGLANLIVRSREDLGIVGVVDLEWSYAGPAQLFGSPWWLLQDRPVNSAWDCNQEEEPAIGARYLQYLEIFIRVLEEEEARMPGHEEKELSKLIKWSRDSGSMWLHMILSAAFNDQRSFPFTKLRQHVGATEWSARAKEFSNREELEEFAAQKVRELDDYDEALEEMEEVKALVDSGKMAREEFVRTFWEYLSTRAPPKISSEYTRPVCRASA